MRLLRWSFLSPLAITMVFGAMEHGQAVIDRKSEWISPKTSAKNLGQPIGASAKPSKTVSIQQTMIALELPFENRIAAIRAQGPQGYKNLRDIMFGRDSKIDSAGVRRWRWGVSVVLQSSRA